MTRIGISGYVGNRKTGIGRVLENVLIRMCRIAPTFEFILFVNYDFDDYLNQSWPSNVKVVPFGVSKNSPLKNIWWHQLGFQRLLREHGCACSWIPNFSLLLWSEVPVVAVVHDMIEFHVAGKFDRFRMVYRQLAVPRLARKANEVITVSESSKQDIIRYCGISASKITVASNGCDFDVFQPVVGRKLADRLRLWGLEPLSYLLTVGTIDYPGKNVMSVLRAYVALREQQSTRQKLVVVGKPGHNAQKIYGYISSSIFRSDIIVLGYLGDADLPYLYSGATALCFMSLYEGFGLPVLEAMACGCPVICSNTSAMPEIVEGTGITVDPLDVDAIMCAIQKVEHSLLTRDQLVLTALKRSRRFSWDTTARIYLNTFHRVLNYNTH